VVPVPSPPYEHHEARAHEKPQREQGKIVWGGHGRRGQGTIVDSSESREAPHATAERFEQIPRISNQEQPTDRSDRDGAVEWAGRGICAGKCRRALPLTKLAVDESALLKLPPRWREEKGSGESKDRRIRTECYRR